MNKQPFNTEDFAAGTRPSLVPLVMLRIAMLVAVAIMAYGALLTQTDGRVYAEEHAEVHAPTTTQVENIDLKQVKKPTTEKPKAPVAKPKPTVIATATPSGSCESWMAQAGIPITASTRQLIINESGCRPNAVNPTSGACGIPQALPCSKMPCTLQDPVCQLQWMSNYVKERYNTWEGALAFWHCIGTCYNNYGSVYKTATWY